jgi:hypothetical protein
LRCFITSPTTWRVDTRNCQGRTGLPSRFCPRRHAANVKPGRCPAVRSPRRCAESLFHRLLLETSSSPSSICSSLAGAGTVSVSHPVPQVMALVATDGNGWARCGRKDRDDHTPLELQVAQYRRRTGCQNRHGTTSLEIVHRPKIHCRLNVSDCSTRRLRQSGSSCHQSRSRLHDALGDRSSRLPRYCRRRKSCPIRETPG